MVFDVCVIISEGFKVEFVIVTALSGLCRSAPKLRVKRGFLRRARAGSSGQG